MQYPSREGRRPASAPVTRAVIEHERRSQSAGHDNDGFLSVSHGFIPREPPLTRLSEPFQAWDKLAAELPELHRSLELRRRVERLPVLDASAAALDDREVLRACALLAIVAHAYWYVEPRAPLALPLAVSEPWAQLRARLGRQQEVLSYIDLVVYNWRLRDPERSEPWVVENLDMLFPNDEERIFYMTQLEILARARPVVKLAAAAHDAVVRGDDRAIEHALEGIIEVLRAIVQRSLPKIDPRPGAPTYMSPVVWAKTVAPFAVPFRSGLQGPSGTSSPLFNTLDLFFGRKDYATFLGREIEQLRATYPRGWQAFLAAMAQVSVAEHVRRSGSPALKDAFREALELYAGDDGFLGRHRMKVYGFLELAFKVGRSVTIGGFSGVFRDRTWNVVDDALEASRAERGSSAAVRAEPRGVTPQTSRVYDYSEVAQHNDDQRGHWLVIEGTVYDVSELMRLHPGGRRILQLYAGMDASQGFARAHAGRRHVHAMRERYRIGTVRALKLDESTAGVHRAFAGALQLIVEMQNALAAEQSLQTEPIGPGDHPSERTPYKLARAAETRQRFLLEYLGLLSGETLPKLRRASCAAHFPDPLGAWPRDALHVEAPSAAFDAREAEVLDRELLAAIKGELTAMLRLFERPALAGDETRAPSLQAGFVRIAALVQTYVSRVAPAH